VARQDRSVWLKSNVDRERLKAKVHSFSTLAKSQWKNACTSVDGLLLTVGLGSYCCLIMQPRLTRILERKPSELQTRKSMRPIKHLSRKHRPSSSPVLPPFCLICACSSPVRFSTTSWKIHSSCSSCRLADAMYRFFPCHCYLDLHMLTRRRTTLYPKRLLQAPRGARRGMQSRTFNLRRTISTLHLGLVGPGYWSAERRLAWRSHHRGSIREQVSRVPGNPPAEPCRAIT
jgi:hypothetical protein